MNALDLEARLRLLTRGERAWARTVLHTAHLHAPTPRLAALLAEMFGQIDSAAGDEAYWLHWLAQDVWPGPPDPFAADPFAAGQYEQPDSEGDRQDHDEQEDDEMADDRIRLEEQRELLNDLETRDLVTLSRDLGLDVQEDRSGRPTVSPPELRRLVDHVKNRMPGTGYRYPNGR